MILWQRGGHGGQILPARVIFMKKLRYARWKKQQEHHTSFPGSSPVLGFAPMAWKQARFKKTKRSQCQCFWFELLRSSSFEVFLTVKKSRGLFAVEIHGYQCSSEEAYCSWRFLGHIQPPKVQHSQLTPLASLKHPVEHPIFVVSTLSS